jgi:2-polyprenyl-6-methoxyphenol hydroxylase-like FAD-dependent oxidoreductase
MTTLITKRDPQAATDDETTCCIVGGGPAGVMLALLLARRGVDVTLLEAHMDFDREFRGDTIHPSVMEVLDELGLADRVLGLRHTKLNKLDLQTASGTLRITPFERLRTRFRYITLMPQAEFLNFMVNEAQQYPSFKLLMGARVERLIEEDGVVRGVRYHAADGPHELRAHLTVGADGRFSKLRKLAGIEPIKTSPPMDVLWFKLPRRSDDPEEVQARFKHGHILIMLNRFDYWQCALIIPKGSYGALHDTGIPALRGRLAELAPMVADRVDAIHEWKQLSLLSVESSRCPRWYQPGLLLIGDAAHTMSPVAGVGINYAIMDAVATANLLWRALKARRVDEKLLRSVQRRREWPTRVVQTIQALLQKRLIAGVFDSDAPPNIPPLVRRVLRSPSLLRLPAWVMGYGVLPEHVRG